ncbi:CU044_5270 family protein [Streptomyces sp. NPDC007074]|uniref:CU044_5270 family protein n=1 Tax=Streptomyces sp. NPDC007074 TaxID=3156764 RepID=UPI0033D99C1E
METTQNSRHPAQWAESASLLPQAARDLPAGRHEFHKRRLMAHIQQDIQLGGSAMTATAARPKTRRLRLPRPVVVLPVMALAAVGALVAGVALDGGGARSGGVATGPALTTPVGVTTTKGLPQLLEQVSAAAGKETHSPVKPGQYVYIESEAANTFVKTVGKKSSLASFVLHRRQTWLSPDGTKGWLIDPTVNKNSEGETLSLPDEEGNTPKAGVGHPSYEFLAQLTTDPDELLELIYKETKGQGNTPDQQAFDTIGALLTESYPPAELYSALFKAAAKIPGVVMVNDAQDAIGRRGVAVARLDETSGARQEWIFDKKTHVFLGERTVQVRTVFEYGVAVKPGTVRYTSAITKRSIVDGMRQPPARNS